jgi:hypothetical protein
VDYTRAKEIYNIYDQWQYILFDEPGQDEIRGSAEFAGLAESVREVFLSNAALGNISALIAWTEGLLGAAQRDLLKKADALVYAQYYEMEEKANRFSWIPSLASHEEDMYAHDIAPSTLKTIEPLFASEAMESALDGLKGKALSMGLWFDQGWSHSQYRENTDVAEANVLRAAMESEWKKYQVIIATENRLYAELRERLGQLQYLNISTESLEDLEAEKKTAMTAALQRYDNYVRGDYDRIVKALDRSCDEYNAMIDRSDAAYREMEDARLFVRKRQEIQDWADSVYLRNFGTNGEENYLTPQEKLTQIRYAQERAQIGVEVLNEILSGAAPRTDGNYRRAMED